MATPSTIPQVSAGTSLRVNRPMRGFYDERSYKRIDSKMDLHVSYVGKVKKRAAVKRVPRIPRWKHPGEEPLNDVKKAPEGWHDSDFDINPEDYDSLIKRCDERIEDNILPWIWELRKKEYLKQKAKKDALIATHPPGLSWEVIQRLDCLEGIETWLKTNDEEVKLLSTVVAIKDAYESGQLEWNDGLVTYWSYGKQLCQPRPFDWKEFKEINKLHNGHEGFWVEGLHGNQPQPINMVYQHQISTKAPRPSNYAQTVSVTLRLPNQEIAPGVAAAQVNWVAGVFECLDDTGSNLTVIKHEDIVWLRANQDAIIGTGGHISPPPPIMGISSARVANDQTIHFIVRSLEAMIHDAAGAPMLPAWDTIEVAIHPENIGTRLLGPWLRSRLFTASAPNGTNNLMMFNKKGGINQHLPNPGYTSGGLPAALPLISQATFTTNTGLPWVNHPGDPPGGNAVTPAVAAAALAAVAAGGAGGAPA